MLPTKTVLPRPADRSAPETGSACSQPLTLREALFVDLANYLAVIENSPICRFLDSFSHFFSIFAEFNALFNDNFSNLQITTQRYPENMKLIPLYELFSTIRHF